MRTATVLIAVSLLVAAYLVPASPPMAKAQAPAHETATVELVPLWSRGGEDDEEVMFGVPRDVAGGPDGRVLVLDDQLSQVHVFTADGEFAGSLGREGDGPGELRRPTGLAVLPDGHVAVGRAFGAQFEKLDLEGTPSGSLHLGGDGPQTGVLLLYGSACRGGTLLAATSTSAFDQSTGQMDRVQNLDVFHLDGSRRASISEASTALDFTGVRPIVETEVLRHFLIVNAVGPDGHVYVPHARDEYVVDVFSPDGELVMQIARPDFQAPQRTDRERKRLEALVASWGANAGFEVNIEYARTEMTVTNLLVDERGHLFVQHAASRRDLPAGAFLRLDEFGPDGVWLREVVLAGVGDPHMDTLAWLGEGRVAVIRGGVLIDLERWRDSAVFWQDEDEGEVVPEIIVCRWGH